MQNDLKLTGRTLWRQKEFSLLNILGLAVGIGAGLLIFLVIRYESSFDQFHTRRKQIYRVVTSLSSRKGDINYLGCVPPPLPGAIRQDFPQFQSVAALWQVGKTQFTIPPGKTAFADATDKKLKQEKGTFYTEPTLFDIFDFPWLAGNPHTALKEPNTAALTRSVADAWFGNWKEAVGRIIYMGDNKIPFTITGVLEDLPPNTDIPLRVVLSYATFKAMRGGVLDDWGNFSSHSECFLLLDKGQDIRTLEASQLPHFTNRYFGPIQGEGHIGVLFQPLKDVHFDDRFETYGEPGISREELWVLACIGIFLVLVACINFINLSTAQSFGRSKEIGVRKVLGSSREQLLGRTFRETACIVSVALLLGCIMAEIALPFLSNLIGRTLSMNVIRQPAIVLFLVGTGILVTFLSAIYPGLVLSSFDPITAIRNKIDSAKVGGISIRRSLVVFQFVIAQLLIIGTLVVIRQMNYFNNRPTGFDKKAIVMVDLPGNRPSDRPRFDYLKTQILQIPGVEQASLCSDPPARNGSWDVNFIFGNDPKWQPFNLISRYADTAYLRTFHMTLAAGRYPYASDTIRELVVNEATVRRLGIKSASDILNKTISFDAVRHYPIVGVVRDFNSKSLKEPIAPLVLSTALDQYQKLAVRLNPSQIVAAMPLIQRAFAGVFPDHVFDYEYFDDAVMRFYHQEAIIAALFKIFSALAIVISCLGLYGLVSFMAVRRTKEIGIRKVLGASVQSIVYLFSREFTLLIGLAFLIATPLGYYFMEQWLTGFYYHTFMGWQVFAAAILFSVLIAWLAVGYRAARAALTDPVKALKYE